MYLEGWEDRKEGGENNLYSKLIGPGGQHSTAPVTIIYAAGGGRV